MNQEPLAQVTHVDADERSMRLVEYVMATIAMLAAAALAFLR
jgi:hypothetical protein